MFFTEEDYRKIEKWLVSKGIMDTQFSPATTLDGNETIAIVQNGKNVNTTIDALVEKLFLLGVDDFLNITDKYNQPAISLIQAISLIPFRHRKIGQVITFLNEDNKWVIYQFQGSSLTQWNNPTQWVNVIGSAITGELVPDEEDLTGIKEGDNTVLKFKNKAYSTANFSGLGRVYLRKNIAGGKNILTQQMINQENTRYIIQYDYDLNSNAISIPANSVLDIQGGSISNGTISFNNTLILSDRFETIRCNLEGTLANKLIYLDWFGSAGDTYDSIFAFCISSCSATGGEILLTKPEYKVAGNIYLLSNVSIKSNTLSKIYTEQLNNYSSIFAQNQNVGIENVTLDGLSIDQSGEASFTTNVTIQYNCILLYNASNVTIRNCKFVHVGTNCITINGSNCINSKILNNDIQFIRLKIGRNYDVSSIYVNDAYHIISNNNIYNDGTEDNRQGAGIETHGANGIISNNTITNCHTGINIVGFSSANTKWNNNYGRIIEGNIGQKLVAFCRLWGIANYNIERVKISNNTAEVSANAIVTVYSSTLTSDISDISITDNVFTSSFYSFTNITDNSSEDYPGNYSAIRLIGYNNINDIIISNNSFLNFPANILAVNPTNINKVISNVIFSNNIITNAFNSELAEYIPIYQLLSMFVFGMNSACYVKDNTINIPSTSLAIPLFIYVASSTVGTIKFEDNKFGEVNTVLISGNTSLIINDFDGLYTSSSAPKLHLYADVTAYINDVVNTDTQVITITVGGTNKTKTFSGGKITNFNNIYYITCNDVTGVTVGDYILFSSTRVNQQARQVVSIIGNKMYLSVVTGSTIPAGSTDDLTKLEFYNYTGTAINVDGTLPSKVVIIQ